MLRNLLMIALLCISTGAMAQADNAGETKINYRDNGSDLPPIKIVTLKGNTIKNKDVRYNGNLFVMMFNPTCGHCEDETDLLEKNIFLFKKSKLVLACAPSMRTYLETFVATHHTDEFPKTITVGLDSSGLIDKTFRYEQMPQINIYDKNRKLIKVFTGSTAIKELKKYIQ
ncbi:MAG: hypothetical protein H0X33_09855 [Taibaiella sp.]|nr:hypothetical protein [Taibaiella sp.]